MAVSSKRPEYVALVSLILSVVFFGIAFFVGRWSGFFAVSAVAWLLLSAALIWLVLVIQFHQRALAEQEKLDMTQLVKGKEAPTIFQARDEKATLFAVAQRRLQILEKWFIPVFSAIIAVYQIGIGLYLLKAISAATDIEQKQPLLVAIFMTAIAFVSFLMSRYTTGMSAQPRWKPLRAGGSILLGAAVLCFALAISLALAQFKIFVMVNVIAWVISILLIVLGAETALNVVLDIYRPRLKDQYSRSAFDSRLLGIINEPGGILRTAAGAIDYQFGFEVSQTWFYKLLEKAIAPLVLFAAVTLYLLSCIVVVKPNEQAIVERFGNPLTKAGEKRLAGPGLTWKWPWPIDIAFKRPTKMVSEINIGFVPETEIDPATKEVVRERKPLLWGEAHHKEEFELLVASAQTPAELDPGAAPVSIVIAAVPVQYRIKDLYAFLYKNKEPERLLESICYRELTTYAAGAAIEVDDEAALSESLLGAGRAEAKRVLTENIQNAADEADLGVEIVFVGLQGIHPPVEVAADYQKVIGAIQEKQTAILFAHAERNSTLSNLVGSVKDADKLHILVVRYQQAVEENDPEAIEEFGKALDEAFAQAKGDIFKILREAQSYAFEKATLAEATGQRFADQLKSYRAAEQIYKRQLRLAALEEALENIRKCVVVADGNDTEKFIFDFKEKLTPSLLEGLEELSEK
jgi:regulator of protease activity HflC (stomatin/prohibitin superfamily)